MAESYAQALVLTAPQGALDEALTRDIEAMLSDTSVLQTWWLAPAEAWEVIFVASEDDDLAPLIARVRTHIGKRPIDANIVSAELHFRRKKLLIADMDSTMIEQECIDELAAHAGLKDHVAAITERAMRGEIAFEPALRERVGLLKGLPVTVIDDVLRERITLMPGAKTLLSTMRASGAHTCLVSGGFTAFVERVAKDLGYHESHSNVLGVTDAKLDGSVKEPILGREAKLATLIALRNTLHIAKPETLAVGDGANDLAMLGEAGLGVAYRAKPAVAAAAHARIEHADLTALLYLQGYKKDEFATA
ncbi:phosphoserine phosphatase [Variibacter gotjawalensis]|uniref:Phosphoserine phosphatase n=1 Tax=Variibacter gotjawalensis TaxID=1333996 RepID=A0A0S3PU54_9BRAD|nr:phosphoserine phosphatase SerB [Variibacter gotjawalensis]NIK49677.1 phosphoserine phosphatase [Variibacter gotjawalensis]RZS45689.1 phosphoserine phosphatase [Variibacter gotjawalensis]BAT59360.1 phosphoserine phosphatase [Variibacter gotjawalensis]